MPPMIPLVSAISARNAISMAPTLTAIPNPSPVPRAMAARKFESRSMFSMCTVPMVFGCSVSGTSIFEISRVPGAVMMTAVSRCRASTPNAIYAAIIPPETCAMPLVMIVISSDCVRSGRNGRMVSRASDDDLHHTEVVQQRKKRGDENNRWQNLKREDETNRGMLLPQFAKHKRRSFKCVCQQLVYGIARAKKKLLPKHPIEHEKRERDLQPQSPRHCFQLDGAAIGGKQVPQRQHREQSEHARESRHPLPPRAPAPPGK